MRGDEDSFILCPALGLFRRIAVEPVRGHWRPTPVLRVRVGVKPVFPGLGALPLNRPQ